MPFFPAKGTPHASLRLESSLQNSPNFTWVHQSTGTTPLNSPRINFLLSNCCKKHPQGWIKAGLRLRFVHLICMLGLMSFGSRATTEDPQLTWVSCYSYGQKLSRKQSCHEPQQKVPVSALQTQRVGSSWSYRADLRSSKQSNARKVPMQELAPSALQRRRTELLPSSLTSRWQKKEIQHLCA